MTEDNNREMGLVLPGHFCFLIQLLIICVNVHQLVCKTCKCQNFIWSEQSNADPSMTLSLLTVQVPQNVECFFMSDQDSTMLGLQPRSKVDLETVAYRLSSGSKRAHGLNSKSTLDENERTTTSGKSLVV